MGGPGYGVGGLTDRAAKAFGVALPAPADRGGRGTKAVALPYTNRYDDALVLALVSEAPHLLAAPEGPD